jgi:hypothetical protein
MKTNWLVVVVVVLVGTAVQAQPMTIRGGNSHSGSWGRSGGGYGSSYGYSMQRSGVEVVTPQSRVSVTGLLPTLLMKPALLDVVGSTATPSEDYSQVVNSPEGIAVAERARLQREPDMMSSIKEENERLRQQVEEMKFEVERLRRQIEEQKLQNLSSQLEQAKLELEKTKKSEEGRVNELTKKINELTEYVKELEKNRELRRQLEEVAKKVPCKK